MRHQALVATLCWLVLQVLPVNAVVDLIHQYDVEAIDGKSAKLLCKINTDKVVKQVAWYRLNDPAPREYVYYLHPPRFNTSAPAYKNRVYLASDQSSLIFRSVKKEDDGLYECQVQVMSNTSNHDNEIPEEASQTIKLTVHIPPKAIKLRNFISNKNMTLTCQSTGSKPHTNIFWLVKRKHEVREYRSAKIVTEYHGDLADTIGYFYLSLSPKDDGAIITCMVNHLKTGTTLEDDVTLVAPGLSHAVFSHFDWLGGEVPYSTYELEKADDQTVLPSGSVQMEVSPSQTVEGNTSVIVTISAEGTFPEPRFTWWSEDLDLRSGRVIRIDSIQRNQRLFCLVENPVGRVVVSMEITVAGEDSESTDSNSAKRIGDEAVSGVMIMIIVCGTLVLVLVAALLVYYCAFKPSKKDKLEEEVDEGNDFEAFVAKEKLADSKELLSGQPKISTYQNEPEQPTSNEKIALLKTSLDSPNITSSAKYVERTSRGSSTTTSGYEDDLGGSNGVENNRNSPSNGMKRAISQHLQDFDENASFVGDYGSTFGLDRDPEHCESVSRKETSEQESDSDGGSYDSGTSGVEGRYTLPLNESWENVDSSQAVLPQHRPTDI